MEIVNSIIITIIYVSFDKVGVVHNVHHNNNNKLENWRLVHQPFDKS